MSATSRFIIALAILLLLTAAGTVGYIIIEGISLIDALYMSVMTIFPQWASAKRSRCVVTGSLL